MTVYSAFEVTVCYLRHSYKLTILHYITLHTTPIIGSATKYFDALCSSKSFVVLVR